VTITGGTAMKTCLTLPLICFKFSGCLVKNPGCIHADKIGFSYLCRHPDHSKFDAFTTGALSKKRANELYNDLRKQRRDEFLADQDETVRSLFNPSIQE
jgi:hypothetical protein